MKRALKIRSHPFFTSTTSSHNTTYNGLHPVKCDRALRSIIMEYTVGPVEVMVGVDPYTDDIMYCVSEPDLSDNEASLLMRLMEALTARGVDEDVTPRLLEEACRSERLDCSNLFDDYERLSYFIRRMLTGYGPLYPLILDEYIEEIAVDRPNWPVSILHRRVNAGWITTNIVIDENELDAMVLRLSRRGGKAISIAFPYVEALLPEGHRLAATYGREVSRHGSSIVIRKHLQKPVSILDLIRDNVLSPLMAAYLWLLIENKAPILIVGPTASGKTTLLQALLAFIPSTRRIVTIEDTPELNLSFHRRWDALVTRHVYFSEQGEDVDLYKLSKFALRRRADYIVIGEIRGEEAQLMIYAATSGHGTLATFHAENAELALLRLQAPPLNIGASYLMTLWCIIVLRRIPRGQHLIRRVTEISEVDPQKHHVSLVRVFSWNPVGDTHSPASVDGLVKSSRRLRYLSELLGVGAETLKAELEERTRFLLHLLEQGIHDYSLVVEEVHRFYRSRYGG